MYFNKSVYLNVVNSKKIKNIDVVLEKNVLITFKYIEIC